MVHKPVLNVVIRQFIGPTLHRGCLQHLVISVGRGELPPARSARTAAPASGGWLRHILDPTTFYIKKKVLLVLTSYQSPTEIYIYI